MKYIITESRMENLVKEFILNNYDVANVDITTKQVKLGSGPNREGYTSIDRKIINVDINNLDGRYNYNGHYNEYKVTQIGVKIGEDLKSYFGFALGEYGSEWGLKVFNIIRKEVYSMN